MNGILLYVLLLALPTMSFAKSAKLSTKEVDTVLASYRQAKAIRAKVKKTVYQETMQTETKSQGDFYFSKGKLRLDIAEPERTTLVYDGKIIWFESRLDDQHVTVTKMRVNELRRSDTILAALFDSKDMLKHFNLKAASKSEKGNLFAFEAKDKKKSDVQSLEFTVKNKDIQRISYKDRIENRVTLEFSELTKGAVSADKFVYKPPQHAEITEP